MKAYGYSKNNTSKLIELSECTLECSLDELKKLIVFIEKYKTDIEEGIDNKLWENEQNIILHRHYTGDPTENKSVNFIIASRLK